MKITSDEISAWAEKSGKCIVCGGRVQRTKSFTSTLPSMAKTDVDKSMDELEQLVKDWEHAPVYHNRCEKGIV